MLSVRLPLLIIKYNTLSFLIIQSKEGPKKATTLDIGSKVIGSGLIIDIDSFTTYQSLFPKSIFKSDPLGVCSDEKGAGFRSSLNSSFPIPCTIFLSNLSFPIYSSFCLGVRRLRGCTCCGFRLRANTLWGSKYFRIFRRNK